MACFKPPILEIPTDPFPHGPTPVAYAASTEDLATEIQAPRLSVALVAEMWEVGFFCVFCLVS